MATSASSEAVPILKNFFIYNPTFGPREGEEHKKILYYTPEDTDLDLKVRHVGLCEAMVQFTRTFSPNKLCDVLHTLKSRQFFMQPEPDYWIIMTVMLPCKKSTTKDGKTVFEYKEEDIQDTLYQSVLELAYQMFRLFHGPFVYIRKHHDVDGLRHTMNHFFSKYLPQIRWPQIDLLDVFNGLSFLPLDKNVFLRVQSFINLLESSFSRIKHTVFMFTDQLVWSGLEQEDMRVLYKYLTTSLFPVCFKGEIVAAPSASNPDWLLVNMSGGTKGTSPTLSRNSSASSGITSASSSSATSHQGYFLNGPKNIQDPNTSIKMPRIFVNTTGGDDMEELNLLVYHAMGATVCFMIDGSGAPSYEFCKRLDTFVGPHLSSLAKMITDYLQSRRPASTDSQHRFIYFNHMNLAQKSSVHSRKSPFVTISQDLMRLLADINSDFQKSKEDGETVIKTMTDCWVVGRRSDQREFFVVLNQKNANLIEISEEVKRLSATNFNNIFFLD
eukprot:scpid48332/ scgid20331/ Vacuolar fusion protein CCZ1 homolog